MNTSEQINEIAAALSKAQGQIVPAKYDAQNPHLKSRYTTLASVWDAIRKPLSDNGLAVVQIVTTEPDGMYLLTRLMHSSGQFVQATYPIAAGDSRGVSAAQAVGSALTYARRYSLTALVGVVSDDDDDGNSAADPHTLRRFQPQPQRQPEQSSSAGKQPQDPPGFSVWADWQSPADAIQWGLSQGVFAHQKHASNAYAKCKAACQPTTARQMWECWYEDVQQRSHAKAAGHTITDDDLDGEQDETPQFS